MPVTYLFLAEFTKSRVATTPANAPTIDIVDAANPTGALLVDNGAPTVMTNMAGVYVYSFVTAVLTYRPVGLFHTADTAVDLQDIPSYPQIILDANNNVLVSLQAILGTLLTETTGQIAAAFIKFFNKATPTGTVNSIPDAVAGQASGLALVGDQMALIDGGISSDKVATGVVVGTQSAAGQFTVTITVRDSVTLLGIPDALVTVKDSADSVIQDQVRTNASGIAIFSLNAATYKLHASVFGYQTLAAQTLAVSANMSQNADLTAIAIGTPSSPTLCRLYGYEYLNGDPVLGRLVTARLVELPETTSDVILEGGYTQSTSDADGYWYIDLVQGKKYEIVIEIAGIAVGITMPAQSSLDLRTML